MDITNVVIGVQGKPTKKGGLLYEVTFADGTVLKTVDSGLATKANNLLTKTASARYTVQEAQPNPRGGMYSPTNWLDDIASQIPTDPNAATIPIVGGNGASAPAPGIPIVGSGSGGGMSPERESRIVKQSVLSTASQLFAGAGPEALEEMLEVAKRLYAEVYGQANVVPVAQTPEAVAAAVNATVGSEAVAVGASTPQW